MIYYVESTHIRKELKQAIVKFCNIPGFADALNEIRLEILREEKIGEIIKSECIRGKKNE